MGEALSVNGVNRRTITAAGVPRLTAEMVERNTILRGIDASARSIIEEKGSLVCLFVRQEIYRPEQTINEVYFPLSSVVSIVRTMKDGQQVEIGTVGREGTSGVPLLMGASSTVNDCYCQVPGDAVIVPAGVFGLLSVKNRGFRQLLDRYLQAYINSLGQFAGCNRLHRVDERCARWLLMSHDRVDSDVVPLTHEYLAMMLGASRSSVTIAVAKLQKAKLIHSARGKFTVLNRTGLASVACECYEVVREQFDEMLRG